MLVIATAALLVLATTAQAATKYNYGGRDSYEHGVYGREYKRFDPYESHYAEDYREPHHDSYGGDAYSEEPSYTYKPTYRHKYAKRSVREGQQSNLFTDREAQQFPTCIGQCLRNTVTPNPTDPNAPPTVTPPVGPTGETHVPCRDKSLATGDQHYCYVETLCKDAKRSVINKEFLYSTEACCGDTPAPCPGPNFGRGP